MNAFSSLQELVLGYTSDPTLQTLSTLLKYLSLEEHLIKLNQHFDMKLNQSSLIRSYLMFHPIRSIHSSVDINVSPKFNNSSIKLIKVFISSLDGELLSESINKSFLFQSVSSINHQNGNNSESDISLNQYLVEFEWRTERNKYRGMGVYNYEAKLKLAKVKIPNSIRKINNFFQINEDDSHTDTHTKPHVRKSIVNVDTRFDNIVGVTTTILDINDSSSVEEGDVVLNHDLLFDLFSSCFPFLTDWNEFGWFLSSLCSFPSDYAFDVISKPIMEIKKN